LQQVLHVITITRASPEEPTAAKQAGTKLCSKMLMNILQQVLHTIARTRALPETRHMSAFFIHTNNMRKRACGLGIKCRQENINMMARAGETNIMKEEHRKRKISKKRGYRSLGS